MKANVIDKVEIPSKDVEESEITQRNSLICLNKDSLLQICLLLLNWAGL